MLLSLRDTSQTSLPKIKPPLRRVTWLVMARATRLSMALRDKLHEKLPHVTSALIVSFSSLSYTIVITSATLHSRGPCFYLDHNRQTALALALHFPLAHPTYFYVSRRLNCQKWVGGVFQFYVNK